MADYGHLAEAHLSWQSYDYEGHSAWAILSILHSPLTGQEIVHLSVNKATSVSVYTCQAPFFGSRRRKDEIVGTIAEPRESTVAESTEV